jgi:hypothetical protein
MFKEKAHDDKRVACGSQNSENENVYIGQGEAKHRKHESF